MPHTTQNKGEHGSIPHIVRAPMSGDRLSAITLITNMLQHITTLVMAAAQLLITATVPHVTP